MFFIYRNESVGAGCEAKVSVRMDDRCSINPRFIAEITIIYRDRDTAHSKHRNIKFIE